MLDQMQLEGADVFFAELVGRTLEVAREADQGRQVGFQSSGRVIASGQFVEKALA